MRKLTTSLSLLTILAPATAFAQDEAVTLDEIPEESAAPAPAPAPAEAAPAEAAPADAAAAEPAPAAPAEEPVQLEESGAGASGSAGLSASTTAGFQASGETAAAPAAAEPPPPPAPLVKRPAASRQGGPDGADSWEFSYSGYFRAPMRIGLASNAGPQHIDEANRLMLSNPDGLPIVHDENGIPQTDPATGQVMVHDKRLAMHRPVIPDDQYSSWQFSPHNKNDWAEMFFSVGNGIVSGNLALQAFQFTDASWANGQAQFGIGQGWVEIDHDLGFENVNFNAKVGSHWARYGLLGVYDSGEYDTYLIGRTHVMGGTTRVDLTLPAFDLAFEGGFGAKQPDPEMFNRARFTTLAHGHAFLILPEMEFGVHAMHAWASQEVVPTMPSFLPGSGGCNSEAVGAQCTIADDQTSYPDGTEFAGGLASPTAGDGSGEMGTTGSRSVWGPEYPTGTQTILGVDARIDLGLLGWLSGGYSYQILNNALTVDNAIESIHSLGAGNFNLGVVDNYLESPFCERAAAPNESCSNGDGAIGTIMAQYELGLANFGIFPGDMDLKTKVYTMFNHISVGDVEVDRLAAQYPGIDVNQLRQDGATKFKIGADLEFFPMDWMSAGLRFDRMNPTSNELLKKFHGFAILSPRVTFRSKMVTHEEITLQYSRYFYDQRQCEDVSGAVASPADDPFRQGQTSIYDGTNSQTGLPLRYYCTQPSPSPPPPNGFGQHSNGQRPGNRGAAALIPDENVINLSASMWW